MFGEENSGGTVQHRLERAELGGGNNYRVDSQVVGHVGCTKKRPQKKDGGDGSYQELAMGAVGCEKTDGRYQLAKPEDQ